MTLDELMLEVSSLSFGLAEKSDVLLLASANRALRDIYNRRTITKSVRLYTHGQRPILYRKRVDFPGGAKKSLPLYGKAFSMRLCGKGFYRILDGASQIVETFETGNESLLLRGFITKGGEIELWGSFSFTVYDFSLYEEIYSQQVKDIPMGDETVTLDIRRIYGDFMSFISPPTDSDGNEIEGARLVDGKILLNRDYTGEILLTYRRLPNPIVGNSSADIDLPDELIHLLPPLTVSYCLLHADFDKSVYYKEMYEEMMSQINSLTYEKINTHYKDVNGWA